MSVISTIRYVDPSYTELINGTTHAVTGEKLFFGINAFSVLDDAVSVLPAGGTLFANGLSSDISIPEAASLYLTDFTAPLLTVGPNAVGASYSGDIDTFISGSTFGSETSWLVGRLGTISGDVSVLIEDCVFGNAMIAGRATPQLGLAEQCTFGADTEAISLTIRDSTILEDLNLLHFSVLGTTEKPATVVLTMERVNVPSDKWFWITGGTVKQESYADVVFNLSDSTFGNNGTMALSVNHDLGCGDAFKGNITYNVDDIFFHGKLYPVSVSSYVRPSGNKGIFTLNVTGGCSYIESVGGFDTVNIAAGASLSAESLDGVSDIYISGEMRAPIVSGGTIHLLSGGTISGPMDLTGATVSTMEAGSEIQFDISGRLPGGSDSDAQIKRLSAFGNIPDFALSISVLQEKGTYTLATSAVDFDKTITVRNSFDGSTLGTLSVGQKAVFLGQTYELTRTTANVLKLSVSRKNIVPVSLDGLTVRSGQTYGVSASQTLSNATVSRGGSLRISSGGAAENTTVDFGGLMTVYGKGAASGIEVGSLGRLDVYGSGTATEILENGGFVSVGNGANVTFVPNVISGLLLSRGSATVHAGTTATDITLIYGGSIHVCSGGIADGTTIDYNGNFILSNGGTATGTMVNSYGDMAIYRGGTASDTTVNSDGSLVVWSYGSATGATVNSGGRLDVHSSGALNSATVNSGGRVVALGTVNSVAVNSSGRMVVSSGGTMTGPMTFENGAVVSAYEGAVLNFDLTRPEAGATALVNDLSLVKGAPIYTLTVAGTEADGAYSLAGGAAGFAGAISVYSDRESFGSFSVGQTVTVGDRDYTLNLTDGTLSVTVGGEPVPPTPGRTFFTGDFNGSGKALLAVESEGSITIYANGEPWGNGLTVEDGWEIAGVGDFSGDGLDDFLRVNTEGYVVGEMSSGNGTFSSQVLNFKNAGWEILGTGDFNGNGTDDVLIANPTAASETVGLLGYWESGTTWTLINGYSPEWECVATGDYNGDGKCDMLWKNSFEGDGGLTYNAYCTWIVDDPVDWRMVSVANPAEWNFLCSGDFDGDKMNDIAMINNEGVVGIWGVNDGYLSSWSILSAVTQEWTLAGVADFNADGTDDIAWCNTDTGLTGYWQINNKELTTWANIVAL